MSTHANLTGSDLHEPKGVASATANTLYVANGSGSGSWIQIPSAAISSFANPFGAALFHCREEQASNTAGTGIITANTWSQVVLNTIKTNEISASLSGNVVNLTSGTYYVEGTGVCGFTPGGFAACIQRAKLYNVTAGADLVISGNNYEALNASNYNFTTTFSGRFTLSGTANVQLMVRNNIGGSTGFPANMSTTEVYSDLKIWKLS